jgi:hypothetical protein
MSGQAEGSKEETAYHEAGHAVIGCVLQRYPLSVSIVSDGKGAVGKTEFEQDAPPGGFRYFDVPTKRSDTYEPASSSKSPVQ